MLEQSVSAEEDISADVVEDATLPNEEDSYLSSENDVVSNGSSEILDVSDDTVVTEPVVSSEVEEKQKLPLANSIDEDVEQVPAEDPSMVQ